MINKVTPRKLNPSLDSRLRKKDEMLDALNVDIKSDSDGDSGDVGVLKPIKGSSGIEFLESANADDGITTRRVIGSVTDEKNDIIFYFLFSELAVEQGVYAYDPKNILSNTGANTVKTVYTSPLFNFPENGFVKADVTYSTNHEICNLYFTDNRNEPRRLDVKKAMSVGYTEAVDIADFITACPKTPIHPIEFEFVYDSNFQVSEFRNIPGFQFAYQCIYEGGEESAISTYSDIAVPPSYVQQGTINTPNLLAHNTCRLTIPKVLNNVTVYSNEVDKVRILGRIGNDGSWYTIDEVDTNGGAITYDFRNDRVLTGVPDEDVQKQFTSLPRKAQAQTVIDNRLFYGNYVESFDEPEVDASMTLYYRDRPTDFVNLQLELEEVVLPNANINYDADGISTDGISDDGQLPYVVNRKAGYKLGTENLPDFIEAGTVLNVNLTVHPDAAFKVYNTEDGSSYHLSKNILGRKEYSRMDEGSPGGQKMLTERNSYGGTGDGVFDSMSWTPEDTSLIPDGQTAIPVVCGTSASNALSIAGRALNFSCTIEFNQEINNNAKEIIRDAVCQAISGGPTGVSDVGTFITVLESTSTSSYSYNIGLNDEDGVDNIPVTNGDDYRKRLINAVLPGDAEPNATPVGYFIINSADVSLSLNRNTNPEALDADDEYNGYLYLDLNSLTNIQTKNCVPVILSEYGQFLTASDTLVSTPGIHSWAVYSNSYANSEVLFPNILDVSDGAEETVNYNGVFEALVAPGFALNEDIPLFNSLILSESSIYGRLSGLGDLINNVSLLDGEQGPDSLTFGSIETYVVNTLTQANTAFPIPSNLLNTSAGSVNYLNLFGDQRFLYFRENEDIETDDGAVIFKRVGVDLETAINPDSSVRYRDAFDDDGESILEEKASQVEIIDFNSYLTDSGLVNYDRSFKTESNHDFGVVYYDERGRAGNVNKLPTAYVPGYSAEERGSRKGRVEIGIQLNYAPPEWAHHYQIVYAGNSSVSDFVQYTTGGAFVAQQSEEGSQNIYVSLNYLQEHPTVSYSKDFGAVSNEGINDIYTFKQGDRLRIISYYTDNEERIWPRDYDFEIVDSVILTDDIDTNPLIGSTGDDDSQIAPRTGRFLILKNSPYAFGFGYQDVLLAEDVNTNSHNWNDRCVVEIYSPLDRQSSEDRVYYEIGKVYNVVGSNDGLQHGTNPLILRNGDVWWRRVPVNMPDFDDSSNFFTNLITSETSPSKFRDYYLESNRFNDTVVNSRQYSFGKIKTISPINKEIRRDSSITYSDKNNYASQLVRFTSFNPSKLQFKDLPAEHGAINYILNHSDSVFCIQGEKTSSLPVDRSILSDASGVESLIASSKVLGTQKFYVGSYGCDDNPESVVKIDSFVYFANKSRQEVYRFSPESGVSVISDSGMKQYFRNIFNRVIAGDGGVRVVGGYDPLKDEFLISIMNTVVLNEPIVSFYEPPVLNVIDETTTATDASFESEEIGELTVDFGDFSSTITSNSVTFSLPVSVSNITDENNVSIYGFIGESDFDSNSNLISNLQNNVGEGLESLTVQEAENDSSVNITVSNDQVTGGDTFYFIVLVVDGPLVIDSKTQIFETPVGVGGVVDTFDIDIESVNWTTTFDGSEVEGFEFSSSVFSTAANHNVEHVVFQADSLEEVNGFLSENIAEGNGVGSISEAKNSFADYVSGQSIELLPAGEITSVTGEYFPSDGNIADSTQAHVLLMVIHDGSTIKKIETLPLPASTEISSANSPTLLDFVNENGVTVEEAEDFQGVFEEAINSYFVSLAENEDLTAGFTDAQLENLNNFNSIQTRDSDISGDFTIGTNDLLQLLSSYGLFLNIDFLQQFEGQPGFEIATDPGAVVIPPGSITDTEQ